MRYKRLRRAKLSPEQQNMQVDANRLYIEAEILCSGVAAILNHDPDPKAILQCIAWLQKSAARRDEAETLYESIWKPRIANPKRPKKATKGA